MRPQQELIPMVAGECLAQYRKARKLSLGDVSRALNLDERQLWKIERGETGNIAPVYLKGYIRSYARHVGVPEEEIDDLLKSVEHRPPRLRSVFKSTPERNPADMWLRASSYVVASLLVGTLAWQLTYEAFRLSDSGARLVEDSVAAPAGSEGAVSAQAEEEVSGLVNASIAPLAGLPAGAEGERAVGEQAWVSVTRPALEAGERHLRLSVSADSWVEITGADGQEIEMDLLRGGSDRDYRGRPPFRILIGRASAVRLYIDGDPVELAGFTRDDVAQLSWPSRPRADAD